MSENMILTVVSDWLTVSVYLLLYLLWLVVKLKIYAVTKE